MKRIIKIGFREFVTKKDALNHFRSILNSYDYDCILNKADFEDVVSLVETHPQAEEKIGVGIEKVRIAKLKYNTKSFELVRVDGTTEYFSYTKRISSPKSFFSRFREACRQAIQEDLRVVKLDYFKKFSKKGRVKCQETGELLNYEELNVDHRQPNTFSVIVDRFIEKEDIDLRSVKYVQIDGAPNELEDEKLRAQFIQYHKEKANLRIVKKSLNLSRSYQARVGRQIKDLKISDK